MRYEPPQSSLSNRYNAKCPVSGDNGGSGSGMSSIQANILALMADLLR